MSEFLLQLQRKDKKQTEPNCDGFRVMLKQPIGMKSATIDELWKFFKKFFEIKKKNFSEQLLK